MVSFSLIILKHQFQVLQASFEHLEESNLDESIPPTPGEPAIEPSKIPAQALKIYLAAEELEQQKIFQSEFNELPKHFSRTKQDWTALGEVFTKNVQSDFNRLTEPQKQFLFEMVDLWRSFVINILGIEKFGLARVPLSASSVVWCTILVRCAKELVSDETGPENCWLLDYCTTEQRPEARQCRDTNETDLVDDVLDENEEITKCIDGGKEHVGNVFIPIELAITN